MQTRGRWHLAASYRLEMGGDLGVAQVAHRVGYESEEAFSRASLTSAVHGSRSRGRVFRSRMHRDQVIFNHMVERRSPVLDDTYGALSHDVRRALLDSLRSGPSTVTHLAEPFDVSLAAVSKHIGVLEDAGLVSRAQVGRTRIVTLEPRPLVDARAWIDTYRTFWEERLDALEAHLRRGRRM